MPLFSLIGLALAMLFGGFTQLTVAQEQTETPQQLEFFEAKIRPVLVQHCYECHAADSKHVKGGLLLDTRAATLKGGDSGPAVVAKNVGDSLLIGALKHESVEMPPKGKLPETVIADFVAWVEMGAPDPRIGESVASSKINFEEARKFWSFQPIIEPELPKVQRADWSRNDIDLFTLAKMEQLGLLPVAQAGKAELIRRATFDLIGLPPTPKEVIAFVQDESKNAFDKVIDRLLASKHYGERWGRYWLDVARYAEDQAHTFSVTPNSNGFRYRDWVVSAFNSDMSYKQFVKMQIAGDFVAVESDRPYDHLVALGYFGLGAQYYKNSDAAKAAADELDDRVDTLTRGFLGLTVSCARCHDHKFDPIPTQDYYSLAGVFNSSKLHNAPLCKPDEVAAYNAGQQKIKTTGEAIKTFLAKEKSTAAESHVGEISKTMLAVWKHQTAAESDQPISMAELAKQADLSEFLLQRWSRFLDVKQTGNVTALGPWFALDRKKSVLEDEVAKVAEEFQQSVQALLKVRDGMAAPNLVAVQPNEPHKPGEDLITKVFGKDGPLAVRDEDLEKFLTVEKRDQLAQLRTQIEDAKKSAPAMYPIAHAYTEAKVADMKVFVRGNPANQREIAPRRFLTILAGQDPPLFQNGSGRRELAEAIANDDNPLTVRVMVNRIWQHHFGRGIVGTPSNFGKQGEAPTHPELLDYLASRFVKAGWSIKSLHREIMLSSTYQLSTAFHEANANIDGDNRYLWRMSRRRLDVEAWRDALLHVAGNLDPALGGPSTKLADANNHRRTVYAMVSRHELDSLLRLFDFPDANITSEQRSETTVPQQQLFVLNSPFMLDQAKAFSARVHNEADANDEARIQHAFQLAYSRSASDVELELALAYLGSKADEQTALTRWELYAQVLLSGNEFMYLD